MRETLITKTKSDYSADFYRRHAVRYASNQVDKVQRKFAKSSHPELTGNGVLLDGLIKLARGPKGFDAGCGAGAIDVVDLLVRGFDVYGVDVIEENIQQALSLHPELAGRVSVADLGARLEFPDEEFDFVMCNAVIQHLSAEQVFGTTIPELVRVLKPGGVLQLVFKCGSGTVSLSDPDYNDRRSFNLFDEAQVLLRLEEVGQSLIQGEGESLGGIMHYTNNNNLEHCAMWSRKQARLEGSNA